MSLPFANTMSRQMFKEFSEKACKWSLGCVELMLEIYSLCTFPKSTK